MSLGRIHHRGFKLEAVRQVTSGDKQPAQICFGHDLTEGGMLRWCKQVEARGEAAFSIGQLARTVTACVAVPW